MNKEQLKGSLKQAAGKVQEEFGEMVDSPKHVAKGLSRQVAGRAEKAVGDPAEMIVQVAKETGAKLIFIGSRGMGALGTLMLGSTSNKVIHQTRIPVVITH